MESVSPPRRFSDSTDACFACVLAASAARHRLLQQNRDMPQGGAPSNPLSAAAASSAAAVAAAAAAGAAAAISDAASAAC